MQLYEHWDSLRCYPHPASWAFWEHERDQWLTHIEAHVLPLKVSGKAAHDLHTQIELQRQKPRYQPYLRNGLPIDSPAEISLPHIGKLLHLSDPLQKLLKLSWCVGREASIPEDRTLACVLAACQWSDSAERIELLAALLGADEATCKQILAPPFSLVAAAILQPMAWNTATSLLALCSATEHFVDAVDGTYLPWRLMEGLQGSDLDALALMDESEDVLAQEIEREYGMHAIGDIYREGAGLRNISAASIVTLVDWLTGLKLWTSDVRVLDKQLGICDVRNRVQEAVLDAMAQQKNIDELLLLRALYKPQTTLAESINGEPQAMQPVSD